VRVLETEITLENFYSEHLLCKSQLLSDVQKNTNLCASTVLKNHKCNLVNWLIGEGERTYGNYGEYRRLLAKHQEFYAIAAILADIAEKKRFGGVHEELLSSQYFNKASMEVGVAANELKAAVERTRKLNSKVGI
jgi:hypothetical protein